MNNLRYIIFLLTLTTQLAWAYPEQEVYKSHTVEEGETISSIAQKYGISEEAIYRLNPDARKGIIENSMLIIPTSNNDLIVKGFENHRVKRRETLYGIAQKYEVSVDDIKRYNKFLYSRELKRGDRLKIPKLEKVNIVIEQKDPENTETEQADTFIHEVQPKETLYGIARKYGISITEIKKMNPELEDTLPIGAKLIVPSSSVVDSASIEEELYDFYEVQPKEGFYRLKVKLGLTEEQIVALNPYAKDGLKEGMILKIPKEASQTLQDSFEKIDLSSSLSNPSAKNIAVMLPFQLRQFCHRVWGWDR